MRKPKRRLKCGRKDSSVPRRSKVTFRLNILFNFTVYNIKYTVAEALPPPETVSEPPLFCVGALVRTIPDTRPGIGVEHSVATYGTVAEARAEGLALPSKICPYWEECLRIEWWKV